MGVNLSPGTGILLVLSAIGTVLQIPMLWFYGPRANVPVVCLSAWFAVLCVANIVAVTAWGSADIFGWWDGKIYCDIVVRLTTGASVGTLCATTAMARNLAIIMSQRAPKIQINSFHSRVVDLAICLLLPVLIMGLVYLVMPFRYGIVQNQGCRVPMTKSWAAIFIMLLWPPLISVIASLYVCMAAVRLWFKRCDARDILHCSNSGLTIVRYMRVLIFCAIVVCLQLPLTLYVLAENARSLALVEWTPESLILDYSRYNDIYKASETVPTPTQYSSMALANIMFICFGTGKELVAWYKAIVRKCLTPFQPNFPDQNSDGALEQALGAFGASARQPEGHPFARDADEIQLEDIVTDINLSIKRTTYGRYSPHPVSPSTPVSFASVLPSRQHQRLPSTAKEADYNLPAN